MFPLFSHVSIVFSIFSYDVSGLPAGFPLSRGVFAGPDGLQELCPQIPLHASTQMSITSAPGAKLQEVRRSVGFFRLEVGENLRFFRVCLCLFKWFSMVVSVYVCLLNVCLWILFMVFCSV